MLFSSRVVRYQNYAIVNSTSVYSCNAKKKFCDVEQVVSK